MKLTNFGVFVARLGDEIEVRLLRVDAADHKIGLIRKRQDEEHDES
jgi:ribosomal protein S1